MKASAEHLEDELNHFDHRRREVAFQHLLREVGEGQRNLPPMGRAFNMHCHSFFSFNGYGFSPSMLAWKGREAGLYAMGIVDFDVLDGVDEFLTACAKLGMHACAGLETRIFLPEFADRVINSPGEPGISYHMGTGFTSRSAGASPLLDRLKATAQTRNEELLARVNACLDPVQLDFEGDVLPLTPEGNATERHLCMAYDNKARALFGDPTERARFWAEKLGISEQDAAKVLEDAPALQGLIRAKTMKQGGAGYVQPEGPSFPRLREVNDFVLAAGAIPTLTWLDGTTPGEQALDELLDVMLAAGTAAVNIIPERNWNIADPGRRVQKVANLHHFVEAAQARHLPILVGTEMNAHGQRFVDDLESEALAPHYDAFLEGVHILHAHTVLQAQAGLGYLSPWAGANFATVAAKNDFFRRVGVAVAPESVAQLGILNEEMTPERVLSALGLT